jgi:heterodisulfide reductase subunit A
LTLKRFQHWQRKFERQGIATDRLQLRWISAAEGKEFAEKIAEMDQVIQAGLAGSRSPQAEAAVAEFKG